MFEISARNENGFEKILLQNPTNRLEIIPDCGGILNAWEFNINDKWINVIQGYESKKDFEINCESKGFRSCKLSPYACRVKNGNYSFNGNTYNIGKFGFDEHNIHGLVYDLPFEIINKEIENNEARLELELFYEGQDQGFPFKYSIRVIYILNESNTLTIQTIVNNHHDKEIPMSDGWHPYFTLGGKIDEYMLQISSNKLLEFDEQLIPTGSEITYEKFQNLELIGNTFLDNCFVLNKSSSGVACTLLNSKDIKLEIIPEKSYPYLQVFTPDHRNSIAIENLSAAPDAFNNKIGLIILKAGEERLFATTYKLSNIE